MPKINFTARSIEGLKPRSKPIDYVDVSRKKGAGSLSIRVTPTSNKTWYLTYYGDTGKLKRLKLGSYPKMTLSAARTAANEVIVKKDAGDDPHSEKKRYKTAPTVIDLWKVYQDTLEQRQKPKSPNTIRQENSAWKRIIKPGIGHLKVVDVTPAILADMLHEYAKKSPVSANRCHALLSIMFKPALQRGWIHQHPLAYVDKPAGREKPRQRFLTDDEIETLWPLYDTLRRNPRDQLKLGLLTCARPGEIARMKWADIDFETALWSMPDTKTGNLFLLPLSPQVINILEYRKANPGRRYKEKPSQWVFPTAHNSPAGASIKPAESPVKACRNLCEQIGIEHFTPHDLRRTARTLLSRLEVPHHVRERVLNHSLGKIETVYDQYDYLPEKRAALIKLANELDKITGKERKAEKIVRLKTG